MTSLMTCLHNRLALSRNKKPAFCASKPKTNRQTAENNAACVRALYLMCFLLAFKCFLIFFRIRFTLCIISRNTRFQSSTKQIASLYRQCRNYQTTPYSGQTRHDQTNNWQKMTVGGWGRQCCVWAKKERNFGWIDNLSALDILGTIIAVNDTHITVISTTSSLNRASLSIFMITFHPHSPPFHAAALQKEGCLSTTL